MVFCRNMYLGFESSLAFSGPKHVSLMLFDSINFPRPRGWLALRLYALPLQTFNHWRLDSCFPVR